MASSKKPDGKPGHAGAKGPLTDADASNVKGGATNTSTSSISPVLKPVIPPALKKSIDPCW